MLKKILLSILIIILLLAAAGYIYYRLNIYKPPLISDADRAALRLMPLPARLDMGSGRLQITSLPEVNFAGGKNTQLESAVRRFKEKFLSVYSPAASADHPITIQITCAAEAEKEYPDLKEDESYTLIIDRKGVQLNANTQFGVFHGLETILQLVDTTSGEVYLPHLTLEDKPRFAWRGLMLDVSRHWIPKEVVLRILDGMAAAKLNVFHWHLSDDQGFRVESKVYPNLHMKGSAGKYYSQDEIREVISFAAERGIRVVPEFDLPGHSLSWQIAYPELSPVDYPLEFRQKRGALFSPPIDPTKEEVYQFLDGFIGEMADLFPDPYFHIGGDEVNTQAWDSSERIQGFMKDRGIEDAHGLQAYFISRVNGIVKKHGKRMEGWDEILTPELSTDVLVQCWRSQKSLFQAAQQGAQAVLSSGFYLDHKLPAGKHYSVDPLLLPGAVDIVPDSGHWRMYDLVMDVAGNKMESQMVLFDRDTANVFGYFAMMDNRMPFKGGTLENGKLRFKLQSEVGALDYSATLLEDSLTGTIALGLLKFASYGKLSGGSSVPGTAMPVIEIIKPLTREESDRILGGEACMWSEVVNENNVESRIWPRAAAIAEKLWSPAELTGNTSDMYRRLEDFSSYLAERGSHHMSWYNAGLAHLTDVEGLSILKNLTDVLEEIKYVSRLVDIMSVDGLYLPDYPLDHVVDIVLPESFPAYHFNKAVDDYLADSTSEKDKDKIMAMLQTWSTNHALLLPYIQSNEKLLEIQRLSATLSEVAEAATKRLNGVSVAIDEDLLEKLAFLETGEHGVLCAVGPGIRKLLSQDRSPKN